MSQTQTEDVGAPGRPCRPETGGLSIIHAPACRPGPASNWRRMEQYLYGPGVRRPAHESAAGDAGPR